jgi:hypothetical protein
MRLEIEKDIPLPPAKQACSTWTATLIQMAIGDSFSFPSEHVTTINGIAQRLKKRTGGRFALRKVSLTHHRCWRIA